MRLPSITHLQFAILRVIRKKECSGESIRNVLSKINIDLSGPAFYQAMARLEKEDYVVKRYESIVINGLNRRISVYKIALSGIAQHDCTVEFYKWKLN